MNPAYLTGISRHSAHDDKPETWQYRATANRLERRTAYNNRVETVAMCATPELAKELADLMEKRPERDLVED